MRSTTACDDQHAPEPRRPFWLRKDTKADNAAPDMEAELHDLAPDIGDRCWLRAARIGAMLDLMLIARAV